MSMQSAPQTDEHDAIPSDLAENAKNYLNEQAEESALLRYFKKWLFFVGIVISCIFLGIGLYKSYHFIESQLQLANISLEIQKEQLEIDKQKLTLVKDKKITPKQIKELNLIQDRKEDQITNKILSTGIILTLISIIFAVGLTILLNLIKHSFKSSSETKNGSTELATPLGNIILDFISLLKDKLGKS